MKRLLVFALLAGAVSAGCGVELGDDRRSDMTSMNRSQAVGGEKEVEAELQLGDGRLELSADSSNLYSLELEYDRAYYTPEVAYNAGAEGRLTVKLEGSHVGIRKHGDTNRLRLGLSDSLPLRLKVRHGVGEARLRLSRLKVANLDFESGVGGSDITTYEPNTVECDRVRIRSGVGGMKTVGLGNLNFRELDFEGGVGGADLDFTGEGRRDAEIRIQIGVGGVSVRMPRGIGVAVETEKHFLSGVHLDGFVKRDGRYYSEKYEDSKIRISLKVETGIGGFRISWV